MPQGSASRARSAAWLEGPVRLVLCGPLEPAFRAQRPGARLHPESGLEGLLLCPLSILI